MQFLSAPGTFQVLKGHIWPLVAIPDSTNVEYFHHGKKFYWNPSSLLDSILINYLRLKYYSHKVGPSYLSFFLLWITLAFITIFHSGVALAPTHSL